MSGSDRFISRLEMAAANIDNVPRHDLGVLLRRAALRLRNTSNGASILLDPIADSNLTSAAAEMDMTCSDLACKIITEWLDQNTYMPSDIESQIMELAEEMNRPDEPA